MAQPVVLYHLYQLLFGVFLPGYGLELHGCKDRSVVTGLENAATTLHLLLTLQVDQQKLKKQKQL